MAQSAEGQYSTVSRLCQRSRHKREFVVQRRANPAAKNSQSTGFAQALDGHVEYVRRRILAASETDMGDYMFSHGLKGCEQEL
jgi:hypothetical protein